MKTTRYWLPAFLWMGLIFFLSSRPSVSVSHNKFLEFLIFKSLHLIEYGVLFFLIFRASQKTFTLPFSQIIWLSFLLTLIYALSDELHQTFIPTREGRLRDVLIDALGAFVIAQFTARQKG